jgi:hypothetical protein
MERDQELGLLRARQLLMNDRSADRARRVLAEYWPREDVGTLTSALIHLIVDVAHLARQQEDAIHLDELEPGVRRLLRDEWRRSRLGYLEQIANQELDEEDGSSPAAPE